MKKRLTSISILQTGVVLAALYALFALIFSFFFVLVGLVSLLVGATANTQETEVIGGAIGMIVIGIFAPILYGVLGFIFGALLAAFYNVIAKFTGGLEFTVQDRPDSPPTL